MKIVVIYSDDRKYVAPIINAIIEADGLILASPVYGLDVSKYVPWCPNTLKQTEEFVRMCI